MANVIWWRPTCREDLLAIARSAGVEGLAAPREGCFGIWGDAAYGHIQGRLIAEGHWFADSFTYVLTKGEVVRPSAGDPPLYALFLGVVSRLGVTSGTGHRLASSLLGVVGVALIGLGARRLAGEKGGIAAAALAAAHPLLWINDGMLLSESLYVPMAVATTLAALWYAGERSWRRAAVVGLMVGLASATRAEALLLLVLLLVPLVWRSGGWRRRLAHLGVAYAICAIVVGPWIVYNWTRFSEPTFMTSGTGAVLSAGACDAAFYGEFTGYYGGNCFQQYVDEGWVEWPDPVRLDESERDAVSRRAALRYMREHAERIPVVVAARIGRMWGLWAPLQNTRLDIQVEGRGRAASWAGLAFYYVLIPTTMVGLWVLRRRAVPLSPFVSWFGVVTITAAVTFGVTRYRVPADAMMTMLFGVAVEAVAGRSRSKGDGGAG